jgi:hypothetical protein
VRDGKLLDAAIAELDGLDRLQIRKDGKQITIHMNPALLEVKS